MPGRPKPDSDEYTSPRERLARTGYEASVGDEITDEYPPRTLKICLHLSESGYNALLAGFTQEVLDQQREIWIQTRRKNQQPPVEILTDISAREALYEIIAMRPCQEEAEPAGEDCCCCEEEEECCDMSCKCGCGGATDAGTVQPPELGGPPVGTGGKGGGTGGSPGDGPGGQPGSGPDGTINPDGKDTELVGNTCVDIGSPPNQAYNSPGFELSNLDITALIKTAISTLPGAQTGDAIVSAKLQIDGLCWTGFSIVGGPLIPTRKLSVTDSKNAKHLVAFTEERGGLSVGGVGVSSLSYRYADAFGVDLSGPNPTKIDGQMPRSSIGEPFGEAGKDSPAWLTVKVCSAIVRHKADTDKAFGFKFTPIPANTSADPRGIVPTVYWDDNGVNTRAFTDFIRPADGSWNVDSMRGSAVFMVIPADKAYTTLTITGKAVNPDMTFEVQVFDRTVSTSAPISGVSGSQHLGGIGLPADPPGTFEPNDLNVVITMPPMVVGHIYAFGFSADPVLHAQAWIHNLEGKFGGV